MTTKPNDTELRSVVVDALVGMVSGVTGMIPPTDAPLPGFIQGPVDRAMSKIDAARAADKARIAELAEALKYVNSRVRDLIEIVEAGSHSKGKDQVVLGYAEHLIQAVNSALGEEVGG